MRISDWSSDVCSSDLRYMSSCAVKPSRVAAGFAFKSAKSSKTRLQRPARSSSVSKILTTDIVVSGPLAHIIRIRSEEHTSELQSLMRISYAVFCLKKKTTRITKKHIETATHTNTNEHTKTIMHTYVKISLKQYTTP